MGKGSGRAGGCRQGARRERGGWRASHRGRGWFRGSRLRSRGSGGAGTAAGQVVCGAQAGVAKETRTSASFLKAGWGLTLWTAQPGTMLGVARMVRWYPSTAYRLRDQIRSKSFRGGCAGTGSHFDDVGIGDRKSIIPRTESQQLTCGGRNWPTCFHSAPGAAGNHKRGSAVRALLSELAPGADRNQQKSPAPEHLIQAGGNTSRSRGTRKPGPAGMSSPGENGSSGQ